MSPVRAQRIFMGSVLATGLILISKGYSWGIYFIYFMSFMLIFSGFIGFCPSDLIFEKIFKKR